MILDHPSPKNRSIQIRFASVEDARDVATILTEAFPTLYEWTFGHLPPTRMIDLLISLYNEGYLDIRHTRLATENSIVRGIAIFHFEGRIGKGPIIGFARNVFRQLGPVRGCRAFMGGILTNLLISKRIPIATDLLYIEALAVTSEARGRGIGSALLSDAIQWGSENGRPRLALHVLQRNTDARRLYERMGFRLQGSEPPPMPPKDTRQQWVSLLMERPATPSQ